MLTLFERIQDRWSDEPFVARVTTDAHRALPLRCREVLVTSSCADLSLAGFRACLWLTDSPVDAEYPDVGVPLIPVSRNLSYLAEGDVVFLNPKRGEIGVLYRRCSSSNTIFLTETCNCRCIMCSQPPRVHEDGGWERVWLEVIPLISPETEELGISGGEPTLLPRGLLRILRTCKNYLPRTALHVLTNGRMFNYISLCREIAEIGHADLVFGIPLHSDLADLHDTIAGTSSAFDQMMRGIINLQRFRQRIELRVVLFRHTVERLQDLARFIARNLPFVEHVALMGLEPIGLAKANLDQVWADPLDYQNELMAAVGELAGHRMNVSIYNHQLCTLDPSLWQFARKSISDWKNEYLDVCDGCDMRRECGGFFTSSTHIHSRTIHPVCSAL